MDVGAVAGETHQQPWHTERDRNRDRDRETERQRDREAERQRDRETDRVPTVQPETPAHVYGTPLPAPFPRTHLRSQARGSRRSLAPSPLPRLGSGRRVCRARRLASHGLRSAAPSRESIPSRSSSCSTAVNRRRRLQGRRVRSARCWHWRRGSVACWRAAAGGRARCMRPVTREGAAGRGHGRGRPPAGAAGMPHSGHQARALRHSTISLVVVDTSGRARALATRADVGRSAAR